MTLQSHLYTKIIGILHQILTCLQMQPQNSYVKNLQELLIDLSEEYDDISLSQLTTILMKVYGKVYCVDEKNKKYKFCDKSRKWITIPNFHDIERQLALASDCIKEEKKMHKSLIRYAKSNMLWIHLAGTLKNEREIDFDTNPSIMCLNNGVLDFKKGVFRANEPEDGCFVVSDIDFLEPTEHDIQELNRYLSETFPNPLMKESALNVFSDALSCKYIDKSGEFRPTIFSNLTDEFSTLIKLIYGDLWSYRNSDGNINRKYKKGSKICMYDGNKHFHTFTDLSRMNSKVDKNCIMWYQDTHYYKWLHYTEGSIPKILNVLEFKEVKLWNIEVLAQTLLWELFQRSIKNSQIESLKDKPRVDYYLSSYKCCVEECGCKECRKIFVDRNLDRITLLLEFSLVEDVKKDIMNIYMKL